MSDTERTDPMTAPSNPAGRPACTGCGQTQACICLDNCKCPDCGYGLLAPAQPSGEGASGRMRCRLCGKGIPECGGWLERVVPVGVVPAQWECRPSCDAVLSADDKIIGAIEGPASATPPQEARQYRHWLECNGDRRIPAGEPGNSCSCFNEHHRAAMGLSADPPEEAGRATSPLTLDAMRDEAERIATGALLYTPIDEHKRQHVMLFSAILAALRRVQSAAMSVWQDQLLAAERLNDAYAAESARLREQLAEAQRRADDADKDALAELRFRREAESRERALAEQLERMAEALRFLRNEAHGMLGMERAGIVELVSLTNVRCLEVRINEADAALAAYDAARGQK